MDDWKSKPGYPKPDMELEWQKHKRLTRINWGLFFGWIPFGAFVMSFFQRLGFILLGAYAITLVVIANIAGNFHCPRCGYRFYAMGPWGLGHNTFARRCRNCGLEKWECTPQNGIQHRIAGE
jgi:hypothetical protein